MKKHFLAIFAIVLAVGFTAFTTVDSVDRTVYYYFQFTPQLNGETDYELNTNWIYRGTSSSTPCSAGSNYVCLVKIDQTLIAGTTDIQKRDNYATFLANEAGTTGATDFVEDAANLVNEKP
jgi:hypothetical protein